MYGRPKKKKMEKVKNDVKQAATGESMNTDT